MTTPPPPQPSSEREALADRQLARVIRVAYDAWQHDNLDTLDIGDYIAAAMLAAGEREGRDAS